MERPADHPEIPSPRIGVLLINLGTPDAPNAPAVRRYLAEFLSDRRVIEIPAIAWKPILHGIILRTRPKKSAHAYRQVWTEEGSPLARLPTARRRRCRSGSAIPPCVGHAMRYGKPGIAAALRADEGRGLRPASCWRRSIRNIARPRRRPPTTGPSGAGRNALAAGNPHIAALLRRSRLYRRAEGQFRAADGRARFHARAAAAELPRHAGADAGAWRSLSWPLPARRRGCLPSSWPAGRCRLPVALRPGEMA